MITLGLTEGENIDRIKRLFLFSNLKCDHIKQVSTTTDSKYLLIQWLSIILKTDQLYEYVSKEV